MKLPPILTMNWIDSLKSEDIRKAEEDEVPTINFSIGEQEPGGEEIESNERTDEAYLMEPVLERNKTELVEKEEEGITEEEARIEEKLEQPWWKRLFTRKPKVEKVDLFSPTQIEPAITIEQSKPLAPNTTSVQVVKSSWWKRLFADKIRLKKAASLIDTDSKLAIVDDEIASSTLSAESIQLGESPPIAIQPTPAGVKEEEMPSVQLSTEEVLTPVAFTLVEVRALVKVELAQAQGDIVRAVQDEFARTQKDHRQGSLTTAQDIAEAFLINNPKILHMEFEILKEAEEQFISSDRGRPLHERMQDVDLIRERSNRLGQDSDEHEKATARRVAEAVQRLSELEGRGIVAEFSQELERQKAIVEAIPEAVQQAVEKRLVESKSMKGGVSSYWPMLLFLILVVAIGLAGIFLPLQNKTSPRFLVEMARMYQAGGEPEEAIRVLDEAVTKGIRDPETLGLVGETYRKLKQYDKAITELELAVKQDPQNENYRLSLASSYKNAMKYPEAISQYQALVEINPSNTTYYSEMGQNYRSLQLYDQALAQYQKALEIDPSYWQGYYYQGEVYRDQLRYDQAIAQFQKVIDINPEYYFAQLWSGVSYMDQNDPARAIEYYQKAIAIDPQRFDAHFYLGEAYLAQGKFDQALAPYQQAIDKNKNYTAAYVGLGKVYVALDDCINAILQFMRALYLDPNNAEAKEGLAACEGK